MTSAPQAIPLSDANSSSYDNELNDPEYIAALLELEGAGAENNDFPPAPEGFPYPPVWTRIPGYQKGKMPEVELIGRVLVKLWNQGIRGFESGAYSDEKVYPLYHDVMYVRWAETYNGIPYIQAGLGTYTRYFDIEDFVDGSWQDKYPNTQFVPFDEAGYNSYTILNDD